MPNWKNAGYLKRPWNSLQREVSNNIKRFTDEKYKNFICGLIGLASL